MSRVPSAPNRRHLSCAEYRAPPQDHVSADGKGIVSQAGALLLAEALRVTGLGQNLAEGLARWRAPRAVHDPGKIITDLVMTLALGGDCLADIAVLRAQPDLAGPVRRTRWCPGWSPRWPRTRRGRCGPSAKHAPPPGSGPGRWPVTAAPGADGALIPVDIDATVVIAHSEKEQAAPTWKKTFGLLTELPELSSQFREWLLPGTVTVPDHDRARRSSSGYGGPRRAAGWFPSGDGRSVGSVSAGRSVG